MYKRKVVQYLRKYIRDLNADQVTSKLREGEFELRDAELDVDTLNHILAGKVPYTLEVRAAVVDSIHILVPWRSLRSRPVRVCIGCCHIQVAVHDPEDSEWAETAAKRLRKASTEASGKNLAKKGEQFSTTKIGDIKLAAFDGFELTIASIEMCATGQGKSGSGWQASMQGLTFGPVDASGRQSKGRPGSAREFGERSSYIRRRVTVGSFAVAVSAGGGSKTCGSGRAVDSSGLVVDMLAWRDAITKDTANASLDKDQGMGDGIRMAGFDREIRFSILIPDLKLCCEQREISALASLAQNIGVPPCPPLRVLPVGARHLHWRDDSAMAEAGDFSAKSRAAKPSFIGTKTNGTGWRRLASFGGSGAPAAAKRDGGTNACEVPSENALSSTAGGSSSTAASAARAAVKRVSTSTAVSANAAGAIAQQKAERAASSMRIGAAFAATKTLSITNLAVARAAGAARLADKGVAAAATAAAQGTVTSTATKAASAARQAAAEKAKRASSFLRGGIKFPGRVPLGAAPAPLALEVGDECERHDPQEESFDSGVAASMLGEEDESDMRRVESAGSESISASQAALVKDSEVVAASVLHEAPRGERVESHLSEANAFGAAEHAADSVHESDAEDSEVEDELAEQEDIDDDAYNEQRCIALTQMAREATAHPSSPASAPSGRFAVSADVGAVGLGPPSTCRRFAVHVSVGSVYAEAIVPSGNDYGARLLLEAGGLDVSLDLLRHLVCGQAQCLQRLGLTSGSISKLEAGQFEGCYGAATLVTFKASIINGNTIVWKEDGTSRSSKGVATWLLTSRWIMAPVPGTPPDAAARNLVRGSVCVHGLRVAVDDAAIKVAKKIASAAAETIPEAASAVLEDTPASLPTLDLDLSVSCRGTSVELPLGLLPARIVIPSIFVATASVHAPHPAAVSAPSVPRWHATPSVGESVCSGVADYHIYGCLCRDCADVASASTAHRQHRGGVGLQNPQRSERVVMERQWREAVAATGTSASSSSSPEATVVIDIEEMRLLAVSKLKAAEAGTAFEAINERWHLQSTRSLARQVERRRPMVLELLQDGRDVLDAQLAALEAEVWTLEEERQEGQVRLQTCELQAGVALAAVFVEHAAREAAQRKQLDEAQAATAALEELVAQQTAALNLLQRRCETVR